MWRKIGGLIIAVSLGTALLVFAYMRSQSFMSQAAGAIENQASEMLAVHTQVSAVAVNSFNSATVHDVAVYDKTGRLFARLEQAEIRFSIWSMLISGDPMQAIDEIIITSPEIHLVQRSDESWNYEDFLSEDETKSSLQAVLTIKDGFLDADLAGNLVSLNNVSGALEFINADALSLQLTADNTTGAVELSGMKNGSSLAGTIKAENIDFADYLTFVPEDMAIKVEKGLLKEADITVSTDGYEWKVNGQTLVLDAGIDVYGTKIDDIDGLALFNEKGIRLFSRAQLDGQPLVLKGTTTLDVTEPVLNMEISSKGFDVNKVLDTFPLEGMLAFKAHIGGKISDPYIKADFSMNEGIIEGYTISQLAGSAQYSGNQVSIARLTGEAVGGQFNLSGIVDTSNENYILHLASEGVNLAALPETAEYGISGRMGTDIDIYGTSTDFASIQLIGSVTAVDGSLSGLAYNSLTAQINHKGTQTVLDYVLAELPQGQLNAGGIIDGDNINLNFAGTDVALAQLRSVNDSLDIDGTINFKGTVERTLSNPWLTYSFKATDGQLFSQPFTWITGGGFGDGNRLDIKYCEMHDRRGAMHEIMGDIGLKGEQPLNITVNTRRTRAEHLFKPFLPEEKITGNVDNKLHISGSLAAPDVIGAVKLSEGSWRGMLINEASGEYEYRNDDLIIKDFIIKSPNVNLKLDGKLTDNKHLDFAVAADEIELAKLQIRMPYPVDGRAEFTGKLTGTVDEPVFDGWLKSDALTLNGQAITALDGHIGYNSDELKLDTLNFNQADGRFALTAFVNLDNDALSGNLSVERGSLKNLLTMFNVEEFWLDGKLNGSLRLDGTAQKPRTHLVGSLDEGTLKGYSIDDMQVDVIADGALLKINKLLAAHEGGTLAASGTINFLGDTDVKINGNQIPFDLITHLCGIKDGASGIINLNAEFTGSTQNPNGRLTLDIAEGGIGTATFDNLLCNLSLADRIISVDRAEVTKGIYKASADGIIPWEALVKGSDEQAALKDQMDLTVRLDEADLQILPILSDYVEWAYGATKGTLRFTGTVANPLINGQLSLEDGIMKCYGLGNPIQNMILDLEFKDDKISLNDMSGTMGNGSYKMTGTASLQGGALTDYEFSLISDNLDIINPYYKGQLNGSFMLTEEAALPKLSGQLDFTDCVVDIPLLPDSDEPLPEVLLDVNINVGNKVRLLNSQLCDMFFTGSIHAGGSTVKPDMSGEINAVRGKIFYLKTPFTIREARAVFNQYESFLPSIALFADTKMDKTKIFVSVRGPLDNMDFKLSSSPAMNQEQIIAALTLRSKYDSNKNEDIGTDELADMLNIGLQMSFLSEVENIVRDNIGVDEFNIVRDTISASENGGSRKEVFNVEVGKYIDDKLLLKYTSGLNYDKQKIGFQYEFNSRYSLNSEFGDDSVILLESRIKF